MNAFMKLIAGSKLAYIIENRDAGKRLEQIRAEKYALIEQTQRLIEQIDKAKTR